jgi:nitrite reductase (NADH) large subunit
VGLEAAGALKNLGVETHVIEFAPMLMAEQLDSMGGEQLKRKIESMGVKVHTSKNTKEIVQQGSEARKPCSLPMAASCRSILSSSPPVFVHATSWRPSAVWPWRSAAVS